MEASRHTADDVKQIRQLLEKYSSSIETFQRVNLKQDIFNYCLCTEEPFELEKFLAVLRSYGVHITVDFSFVVILRTLNDDGVPAYTYLHSSHNNAVMLSEAVRICSDADVMKFKDLFDEEVFTYYNSQ